MSEMDELKLRLENLEKENQKLRSQAGGRPAGTTTTIGDYKGNPVIKFEGPFRPFSFGIRKAMVVLDKIEEIRSFVQDNKARAKSGGDE